MSMTMDDSIKRWAAKRKTALGIEIFQGKAPATEASRSFDMSPPEIEGWVAVHDAEVLHHTGARNSHGNHQ
ncbi:hypothetical protein [Tropicimonas sp. IMCC6043]|uniref:hypothetical protein n=1 Tax=Tropicimonas sp. IMCC6043 TaxID=2510645 RepID=UPI00101BD12D|nr:hypothetical protein [Tropicimonas sp. IMCC6043]RYH07906.1 hypothetical protein EU800_18195 [Tropicimonas sp. IMCC6043]